MNLINFPKKKLSIKTNIINSNVKLKLIRESSLTRKNSANSRPFNNKSSQQDPNPKEKLNLCQNKKDRTINSCFKTLYSSPYKTKEYFEKNVVKRVFISPEIKRKQSDGDIPDFKFDLKSKFNYYYYLL